MMDSVHGEGGAGWVTDRHRHMATAATADAVYSSWPCHSQRYLQQVDHTVTTNLFTASNTTSFSLIIPQPTLLRHRFDLIFWPVAWGNEWVEWPPVAVKSQFFVDAIILYSSMYQMFTDKRYIGIFSFKFWHIFVHIIKSCRTPKRSAAFWTPLGTNHWKDPKSKNHIPHYELAGYGLDSRLRYSQCIIIHNSHYLITTLVASSTCLITSYRRSTWQAHSTAFLSAVSRKRRFTEVENSNVKDFISTKIRE